ncbi:Nudix hydrolase 8, partial [Geodia barretti]
SPETCRLEKTLTVPPPSLTLSTSPTYLCLVGTSADLGRHTSNRDARFKGVILTPQHYGLLSPTEFERRLQASLAVWQEEGRRGVWVKIPLTQSELVPSAAKLGLQFHHAHCDHLMMTKWLPTSEPNNLPDFAHHYIGVAGFVVNAEGQVLLVQEKWLKRLSLRHWKLPGGHTEKGWANISLVIEISLGFSPCCRVPSQKDPTVCLGQNNL